MARVTVQMIHDASSIYGVLSRWENAKPIMSAGRKEVDTLPGLQFLAMPHDKASFRPTAADMYELVSGLQGSIRQHFAGTGANYNSFMSMYSRWRKTYDFYVESRQAEIKAGRGEMYMDASVLEMRDKLAQPVTGWVSYESWLIMLGKAGVLDPATIGGIPARYSVQRENLFRMANEYMELDNGEGAATVEEEKGGIGQLLPVVGPGALSAGKVFTPQDVFELVAQLPVISGAAVDGMQDTTVFTASTIEGAIRESVAGKLFVNCLFKGVAFRGDISGAAFIQCDFEDDCRISPEVAAENVTFKDCAGVLSMPNQSMSGLRLYQCGGLALNVRRAGLAKSHIVGGWVKCLSTDGRTAPRTVLGSTWTDGGLVFDCVDVPENERRTLTRGIVETLVPDSMRTMLVTRLIDGPDGQTESEPVRCGMRAEMLIDDEEISTAKLAVYPWHAASQEALALAAKRASLASAQSGGATTRRGTPVESGMSELERAIARG